MSKLEKEQLPQENEYSIPYHYIANMPAEGFKQHFVDTWGINYISTIEFILKEIKAAAPASIVDVGCGDGRLTREVHKLFPSKRVIGLDYSSRAVNLARAMNHDMPKLQYEQVDLTRNDYPESFDLAVLMEVYEHIPPGQTGPFLAGVHRLLKKGGSLLLTVPHVNKPLEYKHYQHFTCAKIAEDLSDHFDVVQISPFEKRSIFRSLLNTALSNYFFVLNSPLALRLLYSLYTKYLFNCEHEAQCQRIFVRATAK